MPIEWQRIMLGPPQIREINKHHAFQCSQCLALVVISASTCVCVCVFCHTRVTRKFSLLTPHCDYNCHEFCSVLDHHKRIATRRVERVHGFLLIILIYQSEIVCTIILGHKNNYNYYLYIGTLEREMR